MKPMHRNLFRFFPICLLAAGVMWGSTAGAAPRYVDRDTALELAKVLDKGVYRNKLISSTFIRGRGNDKYIVRVVLDNGAEQDWDLLQIREWSKDGSIVLKKNQALVFTSEDDNSFGILDKSRFVQQVLRSTVYTKLYGAQDILSGRKINYGVYRFNLAELLSIAGARDEFGYIYQFILDLENGEREMLSYRGAYDVLKRNGLIEDDPVNGHVERKPYRLLSIKARPLTNDKNGGTAQFGIDLVFDRPVMLSPDHFPYQFYERTARAKARRQPEYDFVIEITAPNAVIEKSIPRIRSLEFLRDIHPVNDPNHPVRVLLRASINPVVLTIPPKITVEGNVVRATFIKVVDQTVLDRQALHEENVRRRQAKLLAPTLTKDDIRREETYRLSMRTARSQLLQAKRARNFGQAYEVYQAALANFSEAASNASNDRDLRRAIQERNLLLANLPLMVVEHAEMAVTQEPVQDPAGLSRLLDSAAAMTREKGLLKAIRNLQKRLQPAKQ